MLSCQDKEDSFKQQLSAFSSLPLSTSPISCCYTGYLLCQNIFISHKNIGKNQHTQRLKNTWCLSRPLFWAQDCNAREMCQILRVGVYFFLQQWLCVCMHACVHVSVYIHKHTYVHINTHRDMCVCIYLSFKLLTPEELVNNSNSWAFLTEISASHSETPSGICILKKHSE